jgi:hypothetical protein
MPIMLTLFKLRRKHYRHHHTYLLQAHLLDVGKILFDAHLVVKVGVGKILFEVHLVEVGVGKEDELGVGKIPFEVCDNVTCG